jgi:hypothetical protein
MHRQVFSRYIRRARVVDGLTFYVVPKFWPTCAPATPAQVVTLFVSAPQRAGGSYGAVTVGQLRAQGDFGGYWHAGETHATDFGLVPNDVATVTLDYPADQSHGSTPALRAVTLTASAVNNVVVANVPVGQISGRGPLRTWSKMTWRAADGQIIKTFNRP